MLKQPAVASQARGGVPEQVFRVFQGSILMIWQYHPQRQWFFLARSQNLTNQLFQPCHSLFKRHNVNVNIVVLNWQNVISVSGHKTLGFEKPIRTRWRNCTGRWLCKCPDTDPSAHRAVSQGCSTRPDRSSPPWVWNRLWDPPPHPTGYSKA